MMTWALASLTSLLPHVVWLQWIYKHAQLGMGTVLVDYYVDYGPGSSFDQLFPQ